MSSDTIISVEKVGKRYIRRHRCHGGRYDAYTYTMLRDVIARQAIATIRAIGKKMRAWSGSNGSHPPVSAVTPSNNPVESFWALKDVSCEIKQGSGGGVVMAGETGRWEGQYAGAVL